MWANGLHKPCCLGGPLHDHKGYISTAVQQVTGYKQFEEWLHKSRPLGCPHVDKMVASPLPSPKKGYSEQGLYKPYPLGAQRWDKWLKDPCPLRGPRSGDGIISGHITPAFLGAQLWANRLHNPCRLGGPRNGDGTKRDCTTHAVLGPLAP